MLCLTMGRRIYELKQPLSFLCPNRCKIRPSTFGRPCQQWIYEVICITKSSFSWKMGTNAVWLAKLDESHYIDYLMMEHLPAESTRIEKAIRDMKHPLVENFLRDTSASIDMLTRNTYKYTARRLGTFQTTTITFNTVLKYYQAQRIKRHNINHVWHLWRETSSKQGDLGKTETSISRPIFQCRNGLSNPTLWPWFQVEIQLCCRLHISWRKQDDNQVRRVQYAEIQRILLVTRPFSLPSPEPSPLCFLLAGN